MESKERKRKHLNADQRRALKSAALKVFIRQYGRKAQKGAEPNDRRYDTAIERAIKHLKPEELDRLLRDDED